jgi:hypothetical protein
LWEQKDEIKRKKRNMHIHLAIKTGIQKLYKRCETGGEEG